MHIAATTTKRNEEIQEKDQHKAKKNCETKKKVVNVVVVDIFYIHEYHAADSNFLDCLLCIFLNDFFSVIG